MSTPTYTLVSYTSPFRSPRRHAAAQQSDAHRRSRFRVSGPLQPARRADVGHPPAEHHGGSGPRAARRRAAAAPPPARAGNVRHHAGQHAGVTGDRKSVGEGKSVSERLELGGSGVNKKQTDENKI